MEPRPGEERLHDGWWTVILLFVIAVFFFVTATLFAGTFRSYVPVTLTSDRAGLVMETGAKVKLRGVQVGRVGEITGGQGPASLRAGDRPGPDQVHPGQRRAPRSGPPPRSARSSSTWSIRRDPSPQRLAAGAVLRSNNVTTEVNTVFQNVVDLLDKVDPAKLNAVLTALAEGVRGQGERIGQAITDPNQVLKALNARSDTIREDWRSFKSFSDTYARRRTRHRDDPRRRQHHQHHHRRSARRRWTRCCSTRSASRTPASEPVRRQPGPTWSRGQPPRADDRPAAQVQPRLHLLVAGRVLDAGHGGATTRGAARTASRPTWTSPCCSGNDPYRYPDNLPIVAAKGGPGGKPGCGSLPDRHQELPGAPAGHQHRLGNRPRHPAQPGHRHPVLGRLLPGHPRDAAAAEHPPVPARPGTRPGPGPGHAALRGGLYGPGGVPLWPGLPPAPPPAPRAIPDRAGASRFGGATGARAGPPPTP